MKNKSAKKKGKKREAEGKGKKETNTNKQKKWCLLRKKIRPGSDAALRRT